jgi:hypothetical protein
MWTMTPVADREGRDDALALVCGQPKLRAGVGAGPDRGLLYLFSIYDSDQRTGTRSTTTTSLMRAPAVGRGVAPEGQPACCPSVGSPVSSPVDRGVR